MLQADVAPTRHPTFPPLGVSFVCYEYMYVLERRNRAVGGDLESLIGEEVCMQCYSLGFKLRRLPW